MLKIGRVVSGQALLEYGKCYHFHGSMRLTGAASLPIVVPVSCQHLVHNNPGVSDVRDFRQAPYFTSLLITSPLPPFLNPTSTPLPLILGFISITLLHPLFPLWSSSLLHLDSFLFWLLMSFVVRHFVSVWMNNIKFQEIAEIGAMHDPSSSCEAHSFSNLPIQWFILMFRRGLCHCKSFPRRFLWFTMPLVQLSCNGLSLFTDHLVPYVHSMIILRVVILNLTLSSLVAYAVQISVLHRGAK